MRSKRFLFGRSFVYVTYFARPRRFAAMTGAARLYRDTRAM